MLSLLDIFNWRDWIWLSPLSVYSLSLWHEALLLVRERQLQVTHGDGELCVVMLRLLIFVICHVMSKSMGAWESVWPSSQSRTRREDDSEQGFSQAMVELCSLSALQIKTSDGFRTCNCERHRLSLSCLIFWVSIYGASMDTQGSDSFCCSQNTKL